MFSLLLQPTMYGILLLSNRNNLPVYETRILCRLYFGIFEYRVRRYSWDFSEKQRF
jgi:hypothetical protein